ncbi:MAG: xanthine phosphoribosyltransferase [Clostridia bacterium]|nr:xanthine phosphoribosyltransferase [Clostridia bacterium]
MRTLEEKILNEGQVFEGNVLKVSSFLNQQLDTAFLKEMGAEIARLYGDCGVNKILTVEASGIAIAIAAAFIMNVPVVFAKKGKAKNLSDKTYSAEVKSFTKGVVNTISVDREYITSEDKLLIIDDFLADGNALRGLLSIAKDAGAKVIGTAVAIEKGFQGGGDALRNEGVRVESLAIVDEMTDSGIKFRQQN